MPTHAATKRDKPPSTGIILGPGGTGVAIKTEVIPDRNKIPVASSILFFIVIVCSGFNFLEIHYDANIFFSQTYFTIR